VEPRDPDPATPACERPPLGSPEKSTLEYVSTIGVIVGVNFPLAKVTCQSKLTLSNIEDPVRLFNALFLNNNAFELLPQKPADPGSGMHDL
jgi:hypothetical protein